MTYVKSHISWNICRQCVNRSAHRHDSYTQSWSDETRDQVRTEWRPTVLEARLRKMGFSRCPASGPRPLSVWPHLGHLCILSSSLLGFSLRPLIFARYIYWSGMPLESDVIGEWLRSVTGDQNPEHTMTGDQRFVISARVIGAVQRQAPRLKVG